MRKSVSQGKSGAARLATMFVFILIAATGGSYADIWQPNNGGTINIGGTCLYGGNDDGCEIACSGTDCGGYVGENLCTDQTKPCITYCNPALDATGHFPPGTALGTCADFACLASGQACSSVSGDPCCAGSNTCGMTSPGVCPPAGTWATDSYDITSQNGNFFTELCTPSLTSAPLYPDLLVSSGFYCPASSGDLYTWDDSGYYCGFTFSNTFTIDPASVRKPMVRKIFLGGFGDCIRCKKETESCIEAQSSGNVLRLDYCCDGFACDATASPTYGKCVQIPPTCIGQGNDCASPLPGQGCCLNPSTSSPYMCIYTAANAQTCEACIPFDPPASTLNMCTGDSQCCPFSGASLCLGGVCQSCIPTGNLKVCTSGAQCCGGICEGGVCKSCIGSGNSCDQAENQCCDNAALPGIQNMFCTNAVPANPSGPVTCQACLAAGSLDMCSASADCCNAGICSNNHCIACAPSGNACGSTADCCTGLVCSSSNVCEAPPPVSTSYIVLALLIPILTVALLYMASYMFGVAYLRAILQDELVQILVTGIIALSLIALQAAVDSDYMENMLAATGGSPATTTLSDAAVAKLGAISDKAGSVITGFNGVVGSIGREASKNIYCNFLGVGFSLVTCSPLNAFRGSFTTASMATSFALADIYAQAFILNIFKIYSFSLIIPIGLLLRCFKISRQAGGALIAIGVGFYAVYPTVIMVTDKYLNPSYTPPDTASIFSTSHLVPPSCEPREPSTAKSYEDFRMYKERITDFATIESLAYFTLVKVIFLSVLNMIITLGFIRALAHFIGSEIDVSALARIS